MAQTEVFMFQNVAYDQLTTLYKTGILGCLFEFRKAHKIQPCMYLQSFSEVNAYFAKTLSLFITSVKMPHVM